MPKQVKSRVTSVKVHPKRGEIWIVDLNPTIGDEISKQRPVVVLGVEAIGLNLTIIVPLTTWKNDFGKIWHMIPIQNKTSNGLQAYSGANCYQIRSISNQRFCRKLGAVSSTELQEITACVQNCVEL